MLRNEDEIAELKSVCRHVRMSIINTVADAGVGHTGGSLSEVEILVALYFRIMRIDPSRPNWTDRDRFILSKGHASPGYYCTLASRGYFAEERLAEFDAIDSMLQGHPCMRKTPGVDMSTGSLGQGLSAGAGMILGRDLLGNAVPRLRSAGRRRTSGRPGLGSGHVRRPATS